MRTYNLKIFYFKLRLKYFCKLFFKYIILKYIFFNAEVINSIKQTANFMQASITVSFFSSKLISTCLFSGKTRAVNQSYYLNRFVEKSLVSRSFILGQSRASW